MKRLVIFICLQGIALALFGQNDYLLLSHGKQQQHIRKIHEGKMVYLKPIFSDRRGMIGKLKILNDSIIAIGGNTILVNNIKKIRVRTTATNVTGGVVIAASLGVTITGIYLVLGSCLLHLNHILPSFRCWELFWEQQ